MDTALKERDTPVRAMDESWPLVCVLLDKLHQAESGVAACNDK